MRFLQALRPEDWKRSIALVILYAYVYQLIVWPLWFNGAVILSAIYGVHIPAPIIVPWEQLIAGTTTLAAVGGIQKWGEAIEAKSAQPPASTP